MQPIPLVQIIRASNLPAVDDNGYSDPYFTVTWAGQRAATHIKYSTLDPIFNENLYFPIRSFSPECPTADELSENPVVSFAGWDYDEAGSSDALG